jgi:hypothetical protein
MDVREPAGSVPSLPGDRFATLIGMVAGTLALSLAGAFVLHPGPWIEMAGRMLGALSFLSM